jgi:glutamate---cysteine ligase / carboxylate-amine ligase
VLLAGLCRAAVMTAVADELAGRPAPDVPDRLLMAAALAAARRGSAADLPELMARFAPALDEAGDRPLVDGLLAARLRGGSGAERQRALWRAAPRAAFVQGLAALTIGSDHG